LDVWAPFGRTPLETESLKERAGGGSEIVFDPPDYLSIYQIIGFFFFFVNFYFMILPETG